MFGETSQLDTLLNYDDGVTKLNKQMKWQINWSEKKINN